MRKAVFVLLLVTLLALSTGVSYAGFANGDPGCGRGANRNLVVNEKAGGGMASAEANSACQRGVDPGGPDRGPGPT